MNSSSKTRSLGFSLVELSVVLVLMSLATGLVMPQLARSFASLQFKSELEVILLRATGLSSLAFSRGSEIVIQNSDDVFAGRIVFHIWTDFGTNFGPKRHDFRAFLISSCGQNSDVKFT